MGDTNIEIEFPLDSTQCLRRECPLCTREFKVQLTEEELQTFVQQSISRFMLASQVNPEEPDEERCCYYCPYCGQSSYAETWWTQEQIAYINMYLQNIMAQALNENLIKPLSRKFRYGKHVSFKGNTIDTKSPWISPEPDDMKLYSLPCCSRKVKVDDEWNGTVHCFFCGFPHTI